MSRQRIPDATGNISLAIVLHICGAKIIRAWRMFSPETLRKLGFRTIQEAHAKRAQGRPAVFHQHTPRREQIIATFDRVSKGDVEELPDLYVRDGDTYRRADEVEIAAIIATATLKARAELVDTLAAPANYILENVKGEASVDKSDPLAPVINFPARTLISANASEATQARINEH